MQYIPLNTEPWMNQRTIKYKSTMNAIMYRQLITELINEWFNQLQFINIYLHIIHYIYLYIININKQETMKITTTRTTRFLRGNPMTGKKTMEASH